MKFTVIKTTSQPDVGVGSDPETTPESLQIAALDPGLPVVEPSTGDAHDDDDDDNARKLRGKEHNVNSSSSSSLTDVKVKIEPLVRSAQKQGQGQGWPETEQSLSVIDEVGASHVNSSPPPTNNIVCRSPTTVTSGSSVRQQESTFPTVNYAPVAQRGRQYALRQTQRLVQKGGECNVISVNVTKRGQKYLADGFTTLVELRWRYQILIFVTQFIISWNAFAVVYYVMCIVHGDAKYYNNNNDNNNNNNTWTPCVSNVYDYTSALLFSLETQSTIGYGTRVINPTCQFGVFVVMLQTCSGTFIQALATGLIFAKISRPKGRARTFLFSRCAVICQRDGQYQLLFRVGDMRIKSHIIGTSLRALMVRSRQTKEGEVIPICQYPLALDTETSPLNDNFVFMVWPVTAVHRIDESSPLWDMSADHLLTEQFEIVVILEGTVESTGSATQLRTSYLPSEIHWGERLAPLVTFQKQNGCYLIDYGQFHSTLPVSMPDCSAHNWALQRELEAADGASISNNRQNADEDYPVEFTVKAAKDPAKSNATRRIRKISTSKLSSALKTRARRATVVNVQSTLTTSPDKFGVWTVADPMRPDGNTSRRESLPHLDLAVGGKKFPVVATMGRKINNNNNNNNDSPSNTNNKRFVSSVTPPRKRRTGSTTVAAAIASNRVAGATSSNPPWEPMRAADQTVIRLDRCYNPSDYFNARHEGRFEITENLSQV